MLFENCVQKLFPFKNSKIFVHMQLPRSGIGYHGNHISASKNCRPFHLGDYEVSVQVVMGCTSSKSQQVRVVTFQENEKREKRDDETKLIELDVNENELNHNGPTNDAGTARNDGPKSTNQSEPQAEEKEKSKEKITSKSNDKGNELQPGNLIDLTDISSISDKDATTFPENGTTKDEAILKSNTNDNAVSPNGSKNLKNHQVTAVTEEEAGLLVSRSTSNKTRSSGRLVKSDLFKSNEEFRDVDSYALEAPKTCLDSFQDLAKYLTDPFDSDLYKARAIWRWVTANISYDVDAFFGNDLSKAADENSVLKTGKAVCSGYSSMVNEISRCSKLQCKEVSGYAKGYNYRIGDTFEGKKTNHSWTAMKIAGQWWLFDMTWGAGYVGNDKKFAWHYNEHFFMTDPEEFILDHFPKEAEWQLIDPPYSMQDFEKWAMFTKHFFIHELRPLSHKSGTIKSDDGKVEVVLGTNIPLQTSCKIGFIDDDNTVNTMEDFSFRYIEGNKAVFLARLPKLGRYLLKLFASKLTNDNVKSYDMVAEYQVNCTEVLEDCKPFPKTFSAWTAGYVLHEPTDGVLSRGKPIKFSITAPNVVEMFICITGGDWIPMIAASEGLWEGEAIFTEDCNAMNIVVKVEGQTSTPYTSILKYSVQ